MRSSDPTSPSASRIPAARSELGAVLLVAATALVVEVVVRLVFEEPEPTPILLLAVAYAAFRGGVRAGLLGAAAVVLHEIWSHSGPVTPFPYVHLLTALGGTSLAMAVLIGTLKRHADREHARHLAVESEKLQTERHLHDMIEGLNAMVWEADATTWRFSFVSRHAETILGYPVQQWLTDPDFWSEHIHPDDRAWAVETCAAATAALMDNDLEYRMIAVDGRVVWLRDLVRVVADEHGRPWKLRGVMLDITERKLAEEALQAREEDFRLLFANNPQPMWVYDLETLRFLEVNEAAVARYGYTREEFLGIRLTDLRPAEEGPRLLEHLSMQRLPLSGGAWRHRLRDGRIIDVEIVSHVLDFAGRKAALVIAQDITERKRAEEALHESHNLLRAVVDGTTDAVYVKDLEGSYVMVNPSGAALLGRPIEEVIGRDDMALFTRESARRIMTRDQQILATGKPLTYEEASTADDVERTYLSTKSVYRDRQGRTVGLVGISRDITERKRMEEALRRSEEGQRRLAEQQSAILDALPAHVILLDGTGAIVSANKAWREFGAAHGVLGSTIGVGENYLAACESACRNEARLVTESIRSVLSSSMDSFELEYRSYAPGEPRSFRLMVVPVRRGRDQGAVVVHLDITHVKWVEEERELLLDRLEGERGRLEAVLQKIPVGILLAEAPSGRIVFGNEQVERIWRHPLIRTGGIPDYAAYTSFYRDGTPLPPERHPLARAVLTGESVAGEEIDFVRGDGTRGTMSVNASAIRDADGRITAAVAAFHDITDRKEAEEALRLSETRVREAQKMDAVGRLAGGIAHDFNNLMMVVAGYSECVLEQLDADHPLRADVEEIRAAGNRAAVLTRQLLAFSRRQILSPSVLDLNAIVLKLDKMLRRVIGEDIELVTRTSPVMGRVKVDPGQMEQVLLNLALNARDAMPKGGTLVIETSEVELDEPQARGRLAIEAGRYVRLAVRDTGCGMDAATQARLFEPFFTTKERGKGTGLGLPMVYGIVTQSEGAIDVETAPGWGTTFTIYLPRVMAEAGPGDASAPAMPPVPPRGAETILLVEDEEPVRTLLGKALRRSGYTVLEARHGEEALALGERYPGRIHLLLTDVVMPRMSGPDLVARLGPRRPDMQVLYMSGYSDGAIAHHGVLPAGGALLQKPFPPQVVALRIREVLDGRPVPAEPSSNRTSGAR